MPDVEQIPEIEEHADATMGGQFVVLLAVLADVVEAGRHQRLLVGMVEFGSVLEFQEGPGEPSTA
jgi:hypothetical protein